MKKIVGLIGIATVLFMLQLSVLAGDIITPLLSEDSAQVYFGKIKNVTDESVTVIQNKNIKGEFERDREYTYERLDSITREPIETGDIYLCRKGDSLSQHPSERESFKPSLPRNVTFPKEKVGGSCSNTFYQCFKKFNFKTGIYRYITRQTISIWLSEKLFIKRSNHKCSKKRTHTGFFFELI